MSSHEEEVSAARNDAGVFLNESLATLEVSGPDRVRFLNGMVTNDVSLLAPGHAIRAIKTNNRGRVEGVLRIRATADVLWVDVDARVARVVEENLLRFIIMDDCTVKNVTGGRAVVTLMGPKSRHVLSTAGFESPSLEPMAFAAVDETMTIVRDDRLGLESYDLLVPSGRGAGVLEKLVEAGARVLGVEARNVVRVEAGVPVEGIDIDDDTIPLEARLEAAISTQKGCYIGQEVIARATNLGGVKHLLVGLVFEENTVPPGGARLWMDGDAKETGHVTSAVYSPTLRSVIGLGFVRTAHQTPGTPLRARGPEGQEYRAVIAPLPFIPQ